jgi:hypothetical protein
MLVLLASYATVMLLALVTVLLRSRDQPLSGNGALIGTLFHVK